MSINGDCKGRCVSDSSRSILDDAGRFQVRLIDLGPDGKKPDTFSPGRGMRPDVLLIVGDRGP